MIANINLSRDAIEGLLVFDTVVLVFIWFAVMVKR